MDFWSAKELRKEFDVIASFYQKEINRKMYLFRNHAVIMRKGYAKQEHPDAVFVMVNPGSCKPEDLLYEPPIIENKVGSVPYVQVKDDPTQRQLMRLMKMMNWNVASICNLSDLCAGNMDEFTEKYRQIESYKDHSIFFDTRADERELFLGNPDTKIILAWGKDSRIGKLIEEACPNLFKEKHPFGLPYSDPKWGYRHPFPMKKQSCIQWLKEMYEQLKEKC